MLGVFVVRVPLAGSVLLKAQPMWVHAVHVPQARMVRQRDSLQQRAVVLVMQDDLGQTQALSHLFVTARAQLVATVGLEWRLPPVPVAAPQGTTVRQGPPALQQPCAHQALTPCRDGPSANPVQAAISAHRVAVPHPPQPCTCVHRDLRAPLGPSPTPPCPAVAGTTAQLAVQKPQPIDAMLPTVLRQPGAGVLVPTPSRIC